MKKILFNLVLAIFSVFFTACNAQQEPINYHQINQPICNTGDFFDSETFHVNNDRVSAIYNAKFFNGKRMGFWQMDIAEQLIRSLKGNVKSIVMDRYIDDGKEYTLRIEFDKMGKIIRVARGFHDDELTEDTAVYKQYSDFAPEAIDVNRNDSVRVSDKEDFFSYTFYKGKPYAMYHLMGNLLDRYSYHSNGNRALSQSFSHHEKMYFNKQGLLDSIADANKAEQPTEMGKKYYAYKDGLVKGYSEYDIKLLKLKNDTTRTRVVKIQHLQGTDLIQRVDELSTYADADSTKESEAFEYNAKRELVRFVKSFNGPFTDYSFTYEYDTVGNWIKVTQKSENADDAAEPFVYEYKITYEYY